MRATPTISASPPTDGEYSEGSKSEDASPVGVRREPSFQQEVVRRQLAFLFDEPGDAPISPGSFGLAVDRHMSLSPMSAMRVAARAA